MSISPISIRATPRAGGSAEAERRVDEPRAEPPEGRGQAQLAEAMGWALQSLGLDASASAGTGTAEAVAAFAHALATALRQRSPHGAVPRIEGLAFHVEAAPLHVDGPPPPPPPGGLVDAFEKLIDSLREGNGFDSPAEAEPAAQMLARFLRALADALRLSATGSAAVWPGGFVRFSA